MLFIDGSWLYRTTPRLSYHYRSSLHPGSPGSASDYKMDYGELPRVVAKTIGERLGIPDVDIVRSHLFASIPVNADPLDAALVSRQQDFFDMLKEEYHYEVELFPIDFRGRRIRPQDRDPSDSFSPQEKCVDIALASVMLYLAAIPQAYDIAVVVLGDRDYLPVLQHVRRLGKRVAIVSGKGACPPEFSDPLDAARVKDVDIVWLDDHLAELELRYEPQQLECQSPSHRGARAVWTTYRPRKGRPFYCDECRERYAREQDEATRQPAPDLSGFAVPPECLCGWVEKMLEKDTGPFGFLRSEDGRGFYFNPHALEDVAWGQLGERDVVTFSVLREPSGEKAGAATRVRVAAKLPAESEGAAD
jgi:hypothetical protein